ncbi:Grpe protein-like protein [Thalictrum thalictroides]|uniref:GrpE protein homolog n=1 Tax=Thalictrum thalictroides TaxID=46969 RepID=A0A7J6WND2_THATH|nr:Grpe protein-like protein [Thalictrum thalictroides]
MFVSKLFSRISRNGINQCRSFVHPSSLQQQQVLPILSNSFHTLRESSSSPSNKWISCQVTSLHHSAVNGSLRFWYSSSAQPSDKETSQSGDGQETAANDTKNANSDNNESVGKKETESPSSDSDIEGDISFDDLVKLVAEKEELLKIKHKEIEKWQDKALRSYAELENVTDRTKREAENSKKFAIQNFAKSLLDVSDNLGRASSVVKESFSKIDSSQDAVGAVALLKTLLEGVEMTEKQLAEVFKKFGLEKYEPLNEQFDPNKHYAIFQIPDGSKPPGTIAAVLKAGYTLHDRILRPAEVGVTEAVNTESNQSS